MNRKFNDDKNGVRAECGQKAVEGFEAFYEDAESQSPEENLIDLIADVMHYAHREGGLDPIRVVRMAEMRYKEEA